MRSNTLSLHHNAYAGAGIMGQSVVIPQDDQMYIYLPDETIKVKKPKIGKTDTSKVIQVLRDIANGPDTD